MTSDARIAGVIDEIYDAAPTPSRWPAALKLASAFLNGGPALLFSEDRARRSGHFHFAWNVSERFTMLYFQDILKSNPLLPLMIYVEPGQPFAASAVMPYDELHASRFFTEYMHPQSMIDIVGAMLEQSATAHVLCGVWAFSEARSCRHRDPFGNRLGEPYVVHVAVDVWRAPQSIEARRHCGGLHPPGRFRRATLHCPSKRMMPLVGASDWDADRERADMPEPISRPGH